MMNWGKGIVIAFAGFISVIATLVVTSMKQDISLVSQDYYVQELAYQDQIERERNTLRLGALRPELAYDQSNQVIWLSPKGKTALKGQLQLFRPAAAKEDLRYVIEVAAGERLPLDVASLSPGLWRAQLLWEQEGREFYMEKTLDLR